jgi:hypothetical protein
MNKDKVMRQVRVNAKLAKRKVQEVYGKVVLWFKDLLDTQVVIEIQRDEFVIKDDEHKCNCEHCNCHNHDEKGE